MAHAKRVAVLSDSTSSGFWFPRWHKYYGAAFGCDALHLITYRGMRKQFSAFDLGGLVEMPCDYDDQLRAKFVSSFLRALLLTHDVVLRCDVDEFLVPDPTVAPDLRSFVEGMTTGYVTARGVDIFESIDRWIIRSPSLASSEHVA